MVFPADCFAPSSSDATTQHKALLSLLSFHRTDNKKEIDMEVKEGSPGGTNLEHQPVATREGLPSVLLHGDQPKLVTPERNHPRRTDDRNGDEEEQDRKLPPRNLQQDNEAHRTTVVTGDTILAFSCFPEITNRDIILNHYSFVRWARTREAQYGKLEAFAKWLKTDEAKSLEAKGQGNEEFTFGQHKGQKFCEIAAADPDYHDRYLQALRSRNKKPNPVLVRYVEWFKKHGFDLKQSEGSPTKRRKTNTAAASAQNKEPPCTSSQHQSKLFAVITQEDTTSSDPTSQQSEDYEEYKTWLESERRKSADECITCGCLRSLENCLCDACHNGGCKYMDELSEFRLD